MSLPDADWAHPTDVETFVVIGGDAAGMSAASKAKRDDPDLEVVVFERGQWVSYSACGMPYYVEGEVEELSDLVAREPETFIEDQGIDLRREREVTAVDPTGQGPGGTVTVRDRETGRTTEQPYDALLIATGASPTTPPVPGTDLENVFTLRSLDEAHAVREAVAGGREGAAAASAGYADAMVDTGPAATFLVDRADDGDAADDGEGGTETVRTAGIVGAGYVGLEMADALHSRGLEVHVFQRSGHVLSGYEADVARAVEAHLRDHGVHLHLGTPVEGLAGDDGRVRAVETPDGAVDVDVVVVGTGVAPNVEVATAVGAETGASGALRVDDYNRTSLPDVYAAGDCVEVEHLVTGTPAYVPLALTANRHGRAVGMTVAGAPEPGGGVVGTAITKVVDMEVARTGLSDPDEARAAGFDPVSRTITTRSRASYYPGGAPITVQLMGCRSTGRLLGGAIAGRDRAGKRIDTVATALHEGLTVGAVERLDLAYAPPFSPTWDPVLTAAKVLRGALAD
jgi:NADPH-dependent 2,4-dienoyl-CoA reductase/sulfur reductase-like enzyme